MDRNDAAVFYEKPEHPGIDLSHVAQFKQSVAKRPG